MPKKKKGRKSTLHYLKNTRTGFYSLILVAAGLILFTMNQYGNANFEQAVLGEKVQSSTDNGQKAAEWAALKAQKEEARREEQQKKLEQKYQLEAEQLKIKYEKENEEIKKSVEVKNEEKQLLKEVETNLIDDVEMSLLSVKEIEIASDGGDVTVTKKKVKARTGFPLSLDVATNQLIVTRPDGTTKIVTVLPDKAVENFMRHKKINLINFEEPPIGTGSGETDNTGTGSAENIEDQADIELVEYENELAYEIKGKKKLKLLGLFDVTTPTTGYVSAETGEVVGQDEPLITQIFDLLSP